MLRFVEPSAGVRHLAGSVICAGRVGGSLISRPGPGGWLLGWCAPHRAMQDLHGDPHVLFMGRGLGTFEGGAQLVVLAVPCM